jgi:signal transduction histidine kinase
MAIAGSAAGVGAFWLAAQGVQNRPTEPGAVLTVVVGVSLLGSGLLSWRERPDNRLGPLMVATAFAWFASLLTEAHAPWLYTIGAAVQYLFVVGFICLVLSFPSGRLETRLERTLAGAALLLAVGLQVAAMLFGTKTGLRCSACPSNAIRAFADNARANRLLDLQRILGAALAFTAICVIFRRWVRASKPQRRAAAPVLGAGGATLAALIGTIVNDEVGTPLNQVPAKVFFYAAATVPVAVVYVFVAQRLARGVVAGLVVELGDQTVGADLRAALARALGDPSLELAYWFPAEQRYVDIEGHAVSLPGATSARGSTIVERGGEPIAALVHDQVLEYNAALVQSVCAAAGLRLENERLKAELRAQLAELQASRARLVKATDIERRRIERDLHDGTQQRLVSIAMTLGLLETKLPNRGDEAQMLVRETREALALALGELRELTQGVHPALLAERGLSDALDELCGRAAIPVRLELAVGTRLPAEIETAAYYFASEALTNAAKHSHATDVRVSASSDSRALTVEVTDNGVGGAARGHGSGLAGLSDRIEALGGRLTISSPRGRGTTLRAEIPCA